MNEKHAQNVPNVKPGVLLCNPRFEEFNADDVFVKDSKDHSTYGVGKWWGGDGAFWDFTKPEGRTAWKKYLTESIIDVGTDSVWNDNCEYDSLMDKDCVCDFDGKGGTIGQLKPIMSTLMCKVGADIGGFAGPAPEAELLLRWIQNGIFQPRFCMNSANNDNTVTQP